MAPKKSTQPITEKKVQTQIPSEVMPRRTLEQVIRVAQLLHNTFAGKPTSLEDVAKALGIGARSAHTKYMIYAAQSYGIIHKEEGNIISLSETGRKIVAPNYDNEDAEGRLKAILTPTLLSKFYSDYDGHQIPSEIHFPNVLESRYEVPRDRVAEAIEIIIDNARYARILEQSMSGEQPVIRLSGAGVAVPVSEAAIIVDEFVMASTADTPREDIEWAKTCFYITPIGDDGTEIRKHADMMLKHLLEPVLKGQYGMDVVRADKIERSGVITQQIFEQLARAALCVADLSFNNPNAFYELGVRHVFKLPTIQIIRKGDKIPFDVSQGRTITIDTSDIYTVMDRFESARRELAEHVRHMQSDGGPDAGDDNPINIYLPGLKVILPK
jgi:hypothetical protein